MVNDTLDGVPIMVAFHAAATAAYVWKRQVDGKSLTFRLLTELDADGRPLPADLETGSRWSWLTGRALRGPLKGRELLQLPSHPILTERFKAFYPNGEVFVPAGWP